MANFNFFSNPIFSLSIKGRLIFGFGLLIFMLIGLGGYFMFEMKEIRFGQEKIGTSMGILTVSEDAESTIVNAELLALIWIQPVLKEKAALMEYVISEDEDVQKALFAKFGELGKKINDVGDAISKLVTDKEAKEKINEIKSIQNDLRTAAINVIAAYDGEGEYGEEAHAQMATFSNTLDKLLREIENFQGLVNIQVAQVNADILLAINDTQHNVKTSIEGAESSSEIVLYILGISLIVAVFISMVIYRSITEPLNDANKLATRIANFDLSSHGSVRRDLSASTNEISVLMTNLYNMRGALRALVSNIQKTGDVLTDSSSALTKSAMHIGKASTEQLALSTQSVTIATLLQDDAEVIAGHASDASNHALEADELVKKCVATDVAKTSRAMEQVSNEMLNTRDRINGLSESAEKIGDIVTVINGIAEQTNLLALNAAIEAARAGEQGRGFAVVADEVRTLAERTSIATSTISEMISNVQTQVKDASQSMELSEASVVTGNEAVSEIVLSLQTIEELNHQLKTDNQEVASGTDAQRGSAMQIAANLETSKQSSSDLYGDSQMINEQAVSLDALLSELNLEVAKFKV